MGTIEAISGLGVVDALIGSGAVALVAKIGFEVVQVWRARSLADLKKPPADADADEEATEAIGEPAAPESTGFHIHATYSDLIEILSRARAIRVSLLRAVHMDEETRVDMLFEVYSDGADSVRDDWLDRVADEGYTALLLLLRVNRFVSLPVEEIPESDLRALLEFSQAKAAEFHVVSVRETEIVYISLSLSGFDLSENHDCKYRISTAMARIRRRF